MAVGRGRTYPCLLGNLAQAQAVDPAAEENVLCGAEQRFPQVAVMIGLLAHTISLPAWGATRLTPNLYIVQINA